MTNSKGGIWMKNVHHVTKPVHSWSLRVRPGIPHPHYKNRWVQLLQSFSATVTCSLFPLSAASQHYIHQLSSNQICLARGLLDSRKTKGWFICSKLTSNVFIVISRSITLFHISERLFIHFGQLQECMQIRSLISYTRYWQPPPSFPPSHRLFVINRSDWTSPCRHDT